MPISLRKIASTIRFRTGRCTTLSHVPTDSASTVSVFRRPWNGKSFDAACSNDATRENALVTFAYGITLNMNRLRGNQRKKWLLVREHPGAFNH